MERTQNKKDGLWIGASFLWLIVLWSGYRFFLEPVLSGALPPVSYAVVESLIKLVIYGSPVVFCLMRFQNKLEVPVNCLFRFPPKAILYGPVAAVALTAIFLGIQVVKNGGHLFFANAGADEVITTIIAAAITEELFFRGWLLNALLKKLPDWSAQLVTAAAFTVVHYPIWILTGQASSLFMNSVSVFIIGLFLGYLFTMSRSIWASMIVHGAYNFCVLFLAVT